jgi:hypothetical protein
MGFGFKGSIIDLSMRLLFTQAIDIWWGDCIRLNVPYVNGKHFLQVLEIPDTTSAWVVLPSAHFKFFRAHHAENPD